MSADKCICYLNTLDPALRELLIMLVDEDDLDDWDGDYYYADYNSKQEYEPVAKGAIVDVGSSDCGQYYLVFDGPHRGDIIATHGLGGARRRD